MGWTNRKPRTRPMPPAPSENTLVQAISNRDHSWLNSLLESGANPNTPHRDTLPLHFAARRGEMDVVDLLCRHGADIDARDAQGYTALTQAVLSDDSKTIAALLKRGADADVADHGGNTPLHHAARLSKFDILRQLVLAGAAQDMHNSAGDAPADILARAGSHAANAFNAAAREYADTTAQKRAQLQKPLKLMQPLNIRSRRP